MDVPFDALSLLFFGIICPAQECALLEDTEEDVNAQHCKTWHTFELLIRSGGIFIMTPTTGFNKVKGGLWEGVLS